MLENKSELNCEECFFTPFCCNKEKYITPCTAYQLIGKKIKNIYSQRVYKITGVIINRRSIEFSIEGSDGFISISLSRILSQFVFEDNTLCINKV